MYIYGPCIEDPDSIELPQATLLSSQVTLKLGNSEFILVNTPHLAAPFITICVQAWAERLGKRHISKESLSQTRPHSLPRLRRLDESTVSNGGWDVKSFESGYLELPLSPNLNLGMFVCLVLACGRSGNK